MRQFHTSVWNVIGQSIYGLLPLYVWHLIRMIPWTYLFRSGWRKILLISMGIL